MTGSTYAMGAPWMQFAERWCGPGGGVFASMTGHKSGHRHQPFGPWDMFGGQFPFGPPWAGGPKSPWRNPKARRGDIRAAILAVLVDEPMNGYQVIQEIAERSGGRWKPSPGSIYPTLQQLEDEGLVRAVEQSGRRVFTLTDEGRDYTQSHADEVNAPWEAMTSAAGDGDENGLKPLVGQVAAAMWQVIAGGTPDQQARTKEALTDLRRQLYAILAEDDANENREGMR